MCPATEGKRVMHLLLLSSLIHPAAVPTQLWLSQALRRWEREQGENRAEGHEEALRKEPTSDAANL